MLCIAIVYKYVQIQKSLNFVFRKKYLNTGRVIIDHIENVDKTEEDCDQETHAASNNLRSGDFWVNITLCFIPEVG